jgi:hypothetical protein
MKHLIAMGAVLAFVLTTTAPEPVVALDLKKTVRKVSRSVSKTVGGLTGGSRGGDDNSSTASGGGGSSDGSSTGATGTTGKSGGSGIGSVSASIGRNGINAKVGSSLLGGTDVKVGALNESGVAQVGVSAGNSRVGASVLSQRQLATLRIDSNPPGTGNVGTGGGGVVGVTPDYARKLLASLDRGEEEILMQRCAMILRSPKAFDAELVLLCRLVAQM